VKWGQNKEQLFISVMVRDLQTDTVSVRLESESDLYFFAKSKAGDENVLELPLRDEVKQDSLKWEIAARPDKWGTATIITIGKGHAHRWDLLTSEMKKFKALIDKDWTREDQSLEPAEEMSLFDDAENLLTLNDKNFNKTIASHSSLVIAARFPWCSECKATDKIFLKAATAAKVLSKKMGKWKKVAFAFLDARENKHSARRLAVTCTYSCEYFIFSGSPQEDPAKMKSQYQEQKLLAEIERFVGPAVQEFTSSEEMEKLKASNVTAVGYFSSKEQNEFRSFRTVANQMRGELVFAAMFEKPRNHIELWTNPDDPPYTLKHEGFSANKSVLENWLRQRSIPLLQDYEWSKREIYERLKLPIARVWYDDSDDALMDKVNATVTFVAKQLLGRMAFVKQNKAVYSYELRDYGLTNPEEFPAFGIAQNISWNSPKFGFDPRDGRSTSVQEFWSDLSLSRSKLLEFCEGVLAGTVPESHESGPTHWNWTRGEVKRFVWRNFHELKSPQTNLLVEIYGKYRPNHDVKSKEVENLAAVLKPFSEHLTVASYDTAENYLPPEDFQRDKYAAYSEWYWIPVGGTAVKLSKPKKDPSIKKVLQFLSLHMPDLALSVPEMLVQFETAMKENPPPETEKSGALGSVETDGDNLSAEDEVKKDEL